LATGVEVICASPTGRVRGHRFRPTPRTVTARRSGVRSPVDRSVGLCRFLDPQRDRTIERVVGDKTRVSRPS